MSDLHITITNDAGATVYDHFLGNNIVILRGKIYDIKESKYDKKITIMVSNGKDKDGNYRPSTFCDLVAKEWTATKGDVVTVRCQYEVKDWTRPDESKAKIHQFRVWEVLDVQSAESPFDL